MTYNNKELWFDKIVARENTGLINGQEYFMPFKGASTHPFFGAMELTAERVVFDNQQYENVPIFYDLYSDVLVLRIRDQNGLFAMMTMDKKKVQEFTLNKHLFRKFMDPKSEPANPSYQYYDMLFQGKNLKLVAKRTKSRHVIGYVTEYEPEQRYYLISGDKWSQISNAKSFYSLMMEKKNDITDFIKTKKIKLKNENDLIALAAFCNTLGGV